MKRWDSSTCQHEASDEDSDDGGRPSAAPGGPPPQPSWPAPKPAGSKSPPPSPSPGGPRVDDGAPAAVLALAAAPVLGEGGSAGDLHSTGPVTFECLVSGMRTYLCNRPPSGPSTLLFSWSASDATSPRGWDPVLELRLKYKLDDSFTVQDRAYWVRYDSETCFLAGPAYTLVRLNGAFVPQSAINYQFRSGPRSISTASLQSNYLRPHTIDVDPMDAPLVGGSSPVRPGSAFSSTRLSPPPPPWPAHLPPPPWEPPCPPAEDPPLPDTFDRWEPRPKNRNLAPPGTPVPPRILTLDVDNSSCHATFHLKAAACQRKAEQAKRIAGANEELSKLDRRALALSNELKSTLGGSPRAALDAEMKQATEEVCQSKRRLRLAKTLIEQEDEEEEKAFLKRVKSRDLPNAPWTHADQQRLMFMEANKYLTDAQRKTESLKAWAAGKDIEAMVAV
jgi:hypothetical protein